MKKLINDPRAIVRETLEGLADTTPGLILLDNENVVMREDLRPLNQRDVAVISGGGSGHEPAHAGYVAHGMLTAAIAGDVFTSPSVDAILSGIRAAAGPRGAVLIVKNYTGDRLNFGLAAELATAEGVPTEIVVVADDVALRDTVAPERRRGIAGTVLVHKVAGAAAARGLPLNEVAEAGRKAAARIGTMGVGLGPCTVPSVGKPGFTLGEQEIELGLGIHGEPGVGRELMVPVDELVERMLDVIIADGEIRTGTRVALLVNGLGATPPIELAIVSRHALAYARNRGLKVERLYSGVYLSALDMPGCSISLMTLDDELLDGLDMPTDCRCWASDGRIPAHRLTHVQPVKAADYEDIAAGEQSALMRQVMLAVSDALIAAETELADLDGRAGDGDLGASMVRGAEAIRELPEVAFALPSLAFRVLADALRKSIAGSSGPFYAVGLARAAQALEGLSAPTALEWQKSMIEAVDAIEQLGGARVGDRTMIDALRPAAEAWHQALLAGSNPIDAFAKASQTAKGGADATADMMPRLGRASYIGDRALGIPDGGAVAVALWLDAIANELGSSATR